MTETRPGLFRVEYRPTKLGTHNIAVAVNNKNIPSSPHKCEVFDPKSVKVTDIGPVVIGSECSLTVDVADAGHGALSVTVKTSGQEVSFALPRHLSPEMQKSICFISKTRHDGI